MIFKIKQAIILVIIFALVLCFYLPRLIDIHQPVPEKPYCKPKAKTQIYGLSNHMCYHGSRAFVLSAKPPDGEFEGPGIVNDTFIPEVAGKGFHLIRYVYNKSDRCEFVSQKVFVDDKNVTFSLPSSIKISNFSVFPIKLNLDPFPVNGTWKINSASSSLFNSTIEDNHTLNLQTKSLESYLSEELSITYSDDDCSLTQYITLYDSLEVYIYFTENSIKLYGIPPGGVFSDLNGQILTAKRDIFEWIDPNLGKKRQATSTEIKRSYERLSNNIIYTLLNDTKQIQFDTTDHVNVSAVRLDQCRYKLTASLGNGIWTGHAVENGTYFYPYKAGPGTHKLVYHVQKGPKVYDSNLLISGSKSEVLIWKGNHGSVLATTVNSGPLRLNIQYSPELRTEHASIGFIGSELYFYPNISGTGTFRIYLTNLSEPCQMYYLDVVVTKNQILYLLALLGVVLFVAVMSCFMFPK